MMFGMGVDAGPTGILTPAPHTFQQVLTLWETPGAAFTAAQNAVTNYSTSFSGSNLQYSLGILAVPIAALILLTSMGGRR